MYKQRQQQLFTYLSEQELDVAFLKSPINIYYYTGFLSDPHERFFVLIADVRNKEMKLFLPSLDEEAGKEAATVDHFIPIADTDDAYKIVHNELGDALKSMAIEKNSVSVFEFEQLQRYYEKVVYHNIEPFILQERNRKDVSEMEQVKRAITITEQGLKQLLPQIQDGMTEFELKALLEYELKKLGAEGIAFDTLVLTGANSAQPHGVSGHRKIVQGDFLLFDFGVTVSGYHSDITRTFVIGEATKEQEKMYETVRRANEQAIAAVGVGEPLKNIDLAAREVIAKEGYGEFFVHRTGHGLGLEVHEAPSIHHENEVLTSKGLLFTIEPGIYVPGLGGVRIEDDIYIREDGEVEILTTFPKELMSIDLK